MLLQLVGITKRFGAITALNKVDFYVNYREVVGLVGDNGAGKSTLAKIIVGYYQPDEGRIIFEGKEVRFKSPADARKLGIEIVYQDMALVPYLSVYRNLFLNRELTRKLSFIKILDKKRMRELTKQLLSDIGIKRRDPEVSVGKLSGGERQSIAIARAVHFGAKLVILDEPTSALSIRESEKVLEYVLKLKERGVSSIIISHNIYHVYSVSDRIVVLDRGVKVLDIPRDVATPEEIIDVIAHRKSPKEIHERVFK